MITALVALGIIFWLFYYFFIRGNAWPILFFIFGIYGGKLLITDWFPTSKNTIMTFMNHDVCYATFIATIICVLAIGVIMEWVSE